MSQLPTDPKPAPPTPNEPGLDAAQQSLSDALRVSFSVLKVLMAVLFVVYLGSGVFRVDEQNTAVRYRFGQEIGTYGPGWHVGLPFPIEQVVMVPRNTQTLRLDDSFWYDNPEDQSPEQLAYQQLDPLKDSFLITGDTNVVHVQFSIDYVIREGDVDRYLRNVGTLDRANELVRTAAERGMIHAIASATIDDIVSNSKYPIEDIMLHTQRVLTDLETGITVQQVLIDLKNQSMPNQVREAYNSVTRAQADKVKAIQDARRTYDDALAEAAGGAHEQLLEMIRAYEAALGYGHGALAEALRDEVDRAIRDLLLPDAEVLGLMRGYMDAGALTAGSEDAAELADLDQARQALADALAAAPADRTFGRPISGDIASRINQARANRTQITNQARLAFQKYASALSAYRETPLVLANDRLQATREKVLADALVQTIVGPVTRINTTPDPEAAEEVSNAEFERRRQNAQQQNQP